MRWGRKRSLDVQMDIIRKTRSRKSTIALASGIGLGIGTVILGIIMVWLLSMQAFLQDMVPWSQ